LAAYEQELEKAGIDEVEDDRRWDSVCDVLKA
jgi:hypothetical protein